MSQVYFHIHIWKTGGTSFLNICRENFGKAFHRDNMLIQNWFLSAQQLRWLLKYHAWVRCYSCHMLSGELPYDNETGKRVVGIAFVRDPVKRFMSNYNYQRGADYLGGFAKENDLDAFISKAIVENENPMWRNGQTFILGGSHSASGLDRIAELTKQGHLICLPTERFDEACILLERLFPNDFKDCSYAHYNVSKQKTTVSDKQTATISEYMKLDFRLLEFANRFLDSSLRRVFEDSSQFQNYLDDFRRRCDLQKRRQRIARLTGKLERGVSLSVNKFTNYLVG